MNPLRNVLKWYEVARDSQTAVSELIDTIPDKFPSSLVFAALTPREAKDILRAARNELDDLTILSLVSVLDNDRNFRNSLRKISVSDLIYDKCL